MFDLNEVIKAKAFDPSALHTVLFQEIERYNILLRSIREQCTQLEKGIQGLVAMSADLQIIFSAFSRALVPAMWVKYAFYSIFYTHSSQFLEKYHTQKILSAGSYGTLLSQFF